MRCLLVRGGFIGEPGASNTNLKSSGGVYLREDVYKIIYDILQIATRLGMVD